MAPTSPLCLQPKEEVGSTLDAVPLLARVTHLLSKSRENYLSRCVDLERLRREDTSRKEVGIVSETSSWAAWASPPHSTGRQTT